jgi:hypothetical protein
MQESTTSDSTLPPDNDDLETIVGLISGEEAPKQAEKPTEDPETGETSADAPETEAEAAAPAAEKAIDYSMEVPIANGEALTLGELKDFYQANAKSSAELIERENAILRQREEASMLLSYVADLPEHVRAAASQKMVADYKAEMALLVEIVPELKVPEKAVGVKQAIYDIAAEYGVPRREIDQIKNAVTVKMLYDFARLKAEIKAAKQNVKPLRAASPKAVSAVSQSNTQALAARAKQSRNSADEAKAVAALLTA